MRVLHLATHDNFGGAARAAYRQHSALLQAGVDSRMLVRHKHTDDPRVDVFTADPFITSRITRAIRRAWINQCEVSSRARGTSGLTDPRADLLRETTSHIHNADILNIHKTEHYVDLPALMKALPPSKPIVLTLHDLSPITGGCDYPGSCDHFTGACGACPLLNSTKSSDYSHRIFRMRQAAYATRSPGCFAVVANSRWTRDHTKRSALTSSHRIELIHYGLDQSIYHPYDRATARKALGIAENDSVICFAAHDLGYRHKGGVQLYQALRSLDLAGSIHLLTMGSGQIQAPPGFRHTHFGRIECDSLQSLIYRAADVFVIPSLDEAFGQTALEAVACGTVVAGFAVGGIVDIVHRGLNGLLVERGDSIALGHAISALIRDRPQRNRWSQECTSWIESRFALNVNANKYIALYRSLLLSNHPA